MAAGFLNNCLEIVQRWFPGGCLLCGASARGVLCGACRADLPDLPPLCPRCALPTPGGAVCGPCIRRPPEFSATRAAWPYAFPADALVGALKFHAVLAVAPLMAEALAARVDPAAADLLVPLPLHPRRLAQRGFNQGMEIARLLARQLGLPVDPTAMVRVADTPPQAGLSLALRRRNVRRAFRAEARVAGLRVALVDDVMTSGATLNAAARALRKAGAVEVVAWVACRTFRD